MNDDVLCAPSQHRLMREERLLGDASSKSGSSEDAMGQAALVSPRKTLGALGETYVLAALLALAVGLTGLGNVNLYESPVSRSVWFHDGE